MKITGKKLFWAFAVILATVFTTGCNVADPDPNAVWLELEFPQAKYPFIQYTGILRQVTEKSVGECRPLSREHLTELIKEGYKKVYYYKAALSLFASADGNAWQPVKFYYLRYGLPLKRNESYDSPDTYSLGFDGCESWEGRPVLDFGKKRHNLPESYSSSARQKSAGKILRYTAQTPPGKAFNR